MHFHSGKIGEIAIWPYFDLLISVGFDGWIKLWEYNKGK